MKLDKKLNEFLKKNSKNKNPDYEIQEDLEKPNDVNIYIWLMKYSAGLNQTLYRGFHKIDNLSEFDKNFDLIDFKFDARNYWKIALHPPNTRDYEITIWI